MDWLYLNTATLDSPQFLGCEPIDRATWLCLLRYCAGQENGGIILGCLDWSDRKWQQLARVTLAEVKRKAELWEWKGNDVHVWKYPTDKESYVKTLRERGKGGAKARWAKGATLPEKPNGKPRKVRKPYEELMKHPDHPGTYPIARGSARLDPSRGAPDEPPE